MSFITTTALEVAEFAHFAATHALVATPAQASQLLGAPLVIAMEVLREGQRLGLIRALPSPARSCSAVYQPTAAALGGPSSDAPRALQADLSAEAICHALLRTEIVCQDPSERWLPHLATVAWLDGHGIAQRGYPTPLVSLLPRRKIVYETVLPWERPDAVIQRVEKRWAPVLDGKGRDPIFVRLAAPSKAVPRLQTALDAVLPLEAARRHLRDLQATILVGEGPDVVAAAHEAVEEKLAAALVRGNAFPHLLSTVLGLPV